MEIAGHVLNTIGSLGMLVCFILVVVTMFQRGSSGIGIASLLLLCCGVGALVAFVYGWIKSGDWGISKLMTIWTICLVLCILGNALAPTALGMLNQFPMPWKD